MITLRGIAQPSDCLLTHILLAYWRKLLAQVCTAQVCLTQDGSSQDGTFQVDTVQAGTAQVEIAQISPAQVGSIEPNNRLITIDQSRIVQELQHDPFAGLIPAYPFQYCQSLCACY